MHMNKREARSEQKHCTFRFIITYVTSNAINCIIHLFSFIAIIIIIIII